MSSTFLSASDAEASSVRSRNRRLISVEGDAPSRDPSATRATPRLASGSSTPLRAASPVPSRRLDAGPRESASRSPSARGKSPAGGFGAGLLDGSWTASWNSVQDLAAGWLSPGTSPSPTPRQLSRAGSRNGSRTRPWAQEPRAASSRPTIQDVGAGVMAEREAALRAARTASVLESHDGVNGGLDVSGRFKARTSDDLSRRAGDAEADEVHAYIHHVQPADTYAGIILKYGCRDDQFKRVNGLWSRDSISTRKWVALPVDACEVKGRPCAAPTDAAEEVDLLAPTPDVEEDDYGWRGTTSTQQQAEDIFGPSRANGSVAPEEPKPEDPDKPWTHVRWVTIDSFKEPVEIGRISKKSFGYFRPRRKKSILSTVSPASTPRPSSDIQSTTHMSGDGADDRGGPSSRRQSLLSNRPTGLAAGSAGMSTPASSRSRSRMGSAGADARPLWMRQPGGIGSLNRNVRAPGPEKDPLNSWAKKHFPALILDSLPSMSVTGAETAQLGFSGGGGPVAEAPSGEAADLSRQGSGLDRAAAAVETWLRGALTKRPGTPTREGSEERGDLIELADTQSEDGRSPARRPEASAPRRGKNKDD